MVAILNLLNKKKFNLIKICQLGKVFSVCQVNFNITKFNYLFNPFSHPTTIMFKDRLKRDQTYKFTKRK